MNDKKQIAEVPSEPKSRAEVVEERREGRSGGAWIWGVVLILMGALFLFQNIGKFNFPFYNWWALFILIPALGSLYVAMRTYSEVGAMTEAVRKPLTGGLILLLVSVMFLFNLDWARYWPFILLIVGGGLMVTALWPR